MKLIDNAGQIWHKLWSVRLAIASAVVNAADASYTLWVGGQTPWRALAAFGLSVAIGISRVVLQDSARPPANG